MKTQKRFTSERAILAEIYSCQRNINALTTKAEQLESKGRGNLRSGNTTLEDIGRGQVQAAERIRQHSIPRIDSKLLKLKDALASFKTPLLFGMPGDDGVVID